AEEDLEHLVRNVRAMCRLQEEMVENEAMRNLSVAANVMYRDGMNAFIDSSKEIRFEAVNRFSGEILPLKVPALMLGEVALADNTQVVDRIQKLLGGICSVFQRVEGKGLLRITTTITRQRPLANNDHHNRERREKSYGNSVASSEPGNQGNPCRENLQG
ncbi:MAG: Cache 3/Cache 2 fusion domain-containing protein, partial [Deltaproteobacteria bacterium]|nr:Cache 3/Cache 2 fusion domain-containing protein [Deltaproteobacteria bacterium]